MDKPYPSAALEAVHETALGLFEAGIINKRTLEAFDVMCLAPNDELGPKETPSSQRPRCA